MISWIQRYFQHHFRTIFAVMLIIMVLPLIWVFNPSSGMGRGDHRVIDRPFFGYNLNLLEDQQRLMGDAGLSANLQLGAMGGLDSDQIQNYAFQRAASLYLADEWHVPASTDAEIADSVKTLRMFAGQDGQFDPKAYATFRDNLRTNPRGLTESDIKRVLSGDVRAKKVQELLAGPGYVLPGDVKTQLARADTSWTLATASADYASFAPGIKPTDADLTKFFEENSFRYEIPPHVIASYIGFPSLNYLASVNVNDADIRAFYDANPSRFPKPAVATDAKTPAAAPAKPDPAADFAAVRPQVETALKLDRAQRLAIKAASDAALSIYEGKITPGPALDTFLATRKFSLQPLAPFAREAGPAELGGSTEIATEAFKLGQDQGRLISEALPSPTGAIILVWKGLQPARKPLFAEVREKVSANYVENEKQKRFVEFGKTVKAQLEARLKAGETFDKAVAATAATAGVKIESKTLAAFTLRNRPQEVDYSALGALERLSKGQLSDMIISADKGLFVYAVDKQAPDLSETNPQFVTNRAQLASYGARLSGNAYLSELVEQELKKSEPKAE
jgi:peptidyl-prolyl cis-trans isomerase D